MPSVDQLRLWLSVRLKIDALAVTGEVGKLSMAGALQADPNRVRPRYFDGRFLAATDLRRDQDYFLARQRELTTAAGAGVIAGLEVARASETEVTINPGLGITPSGDLVVIGDQQPTTTALDPLLVDLSDVSTIQRLDDDFGLDTLPSEPARRRSGLFVLALRSVEYTANPQGAYPSSIEVRRVPEDGDVIEATAVTLVPLHDDVEEQDAAQQRALLARRIFLDGAPAGDVTDALPIALVQLDGGTINWVDSYLVRREIGPEHSGVAGFGSTERAVSEAFALQYQQHLADVLAETPSTDPPPRFAATDRFRALPPAGQMPPGTIDLAAGTQVYFPSGMPVTVARVPEDEIEAFVEEALGLPPIDLGAPAVELAWVSVLILIPVSTTTSPPAPPAAIWYVRQRTLTATPDAVVVPDVGAHL